MRSMSTKHAINRSQVIENARQAVLYRGKTPAHSSEFCAIQPWITQSWQRCLSLGLEPERTLGFDLITTAMQRRQQDANQPLNSAAHATLAQLGLAIAQTRYFAILTNVHGVVINTSGAIDRSDPRASLITRVGVDLSERAIGTSAIGATLAEQHSTWLHQGEHFFADTRCYSCAGTPITGPDGDCMGMLDVTGIDVDERPQLVHLVASSARSIENTLVLATPHVLVLHLHWLGQHGGKDAEGLLCLDDDGAVCAINPMARQMLGLTSATAQKWHISDIFACAWGDFFDARDKGTVMRVPLWSGLQMCVRTSRAGTLAPKAYTRTGIANTPLTEPLKAHETTLIKQTVMQLKGNVAAAAKKLGISRATIYRKLGRPRA